MLTFDLDLSSLQTPASQPPVISTLAVDMPITAVQVTLTRDGFTAIETDLTVNNGMATGRVDKLAAGYWHVKALVYSGEVQIYVGEGDVNVIAGIEVACEILFDPVLIEPTTGAISVKVGMNSMPGYKVLSQVVSSVMLDEANQRFYLLDATAALIGVYDAKTLNRLDDIVLPQAPKSIAVEAAAGKLFLGYPSGQIYTLDIVTKEMTLLGDALGEIQDILPLAPNYLLLCQAGRYYDMQFKIMDRTTGQVLSTANPWYSMTNLLFNAQNGKIYGHHTGVSPTDIHRFAFDPTSGALTDQGDSPYHGDFSMGTPLRLIKNGTRLATASGTVFTSSSIQSEDLLNAGNLGYPYIDLIADEAKGLLYLLNRAGIHKLLILDQSNYFLLKTVELQGLPQRVFSTATDIIIFTEQDGAWFARAIEKTALGI